MGDRTGIEWTDATWNPVTGCTKVSQGCKHCYAERVFPRVYGKDVSLDLKTGETRQRRFTDVTVHEDRLDVPLRWKRPRRIFVNSMSDLFHEDVPDEFIGRVYTTMAKAPQHTFQVLTKRQERMREWHSRRGGQYLPNVWLGVSVEDQATADERIPLLLRTPAAVRWISAEPLLGPIDLRYLQPGDPPTEIDALSGTHGVLRPHRGRCDKLDWIVAGGESGPGARPMHPDWARSLRDQCQAAGVPFLFKQWGEHVSVSEVAGAGAHFTFPDGATVRRVGKRAAGRTLDGRTWDEYPA